ncbi:hypothetical protein BDR04DRAFT_514562 [Suillus decipiens]|nr:hypothetical protein BDR04DRAFT_514562 [Suillus decipiens]
MATHSFLLSLIYPWNPPEVFCSQPTSLHLQNFLGASAKQSKRRSRALFCGWHFSSARSSYDNWYRIASRVDRKKYWLIHERVWRRLRPLSSSLGQEWNGLVIYQQCRFIFIWKVPIDVFPSYAPVLTPVLYMSCI